MLIQIIGRRQLALIVVGSTALLAPTALAVQAPQTHTVGPLGPPVHSFFSVCDAVAAANSGDIIEVTPLAFDLTDPFSLVLPYTGFDLGAKELVIRRAPLLDLDGDGLVDEEPLPVLLSAAGASPNCTGSSAPTNGVGITIDGGQSSATVIEGLTLTNFSNRAGVLPSNSGEGGGMYIGAGCSPIIRSCEFIGNEADDGGAMFVDSASPRIENCFFEDNRAILGGTFTGAGGAIFARESTLTVVGSRFEGNWSDADGGAVYLGVFGSGFLDHRFDDCEFIENGFDAGGNRTSSGAGIFAEGAVRLRASQCEFSLNRAIIAGGGVCCVGPPDALTVQALIDYCRFLGNEAEFGGGVLWDGVFESELTNSLLEGNSARSDGGGIYVTDDQSGFCSGGEGAACGANPSLLHNVLVFDNTAGVDAFTGQGGGVFVRESPILIDSCTVRMNHAEVYGGGIYWENSALDPIVPRARLRASILWENTTSSQGFCGPIPEIWEQQMSWGTTVADLDNQVLVEFVDWQGLSVPTACLPVCATCIDDDPLFLSAPSAPLIAGQPNVDHYLSRASDPAGLSPCVDAVPLVDLRPQGLGTTAADQTPDADTPSPAMPLFDMGFHYRGPVAPPFLSRISADKGSISEAVSLANGFDEVIFTLETDPYVRTHPDGFQAFLFLGTFSGTSPGTTAVPGNPAGPYLPINSDPWYKQMVKGFPAAYTTNDCSPTALVTDLELNSPGCQMPGLVPTLDGDGVETVSMHVPGTIVQTLRQAGVTSLWHSFVVWDFPTGLNGAIVVTSTTYAIETELLP